MNKKLFLLLGLVFVTLFSAGAFADTPTEPHDANAMWIEPSSVALGTLNASVGHRFNVTVWVNITDDISGWEVWILYNRTQLMATNVGYTAGSTSKLFEGHETFVNFTNIDGVGNTHGKTIANGTVWAQEAINDDPYYVSGTVASLMWAEFEVMDDSSNQSSMFVLRPSPYTKMGDEESNPIVFTLFNSSYDFLSAPLPAVPLTGTGAIISDIGSGLGNFLSAIYLPLGNLILILGIIAGVVAIFMGIAYVIRSKFR
jgi:hypothetical protein